MQEGITHYDLYRQEYLRTDADGQLSYVGEEENATLLADYSHKYTQKGSASIVQAVKLVPRKSKKKTAASPTE